jgi:hypothetical protein
VIYDREVERDIPAAEILRDYKPDIDTIHYRVGLLLQIEGERSGRTDARLSRARLTDIIRDRLIEEEHSEKEVNDLQEKITKAAAERLVFLAGLEADRVGFEIRSFQEFMAAECLMEGDDKSIRERLREIGPVSYWRNIFLFAAGKCFAERQHLRDVILTLCEEMNEDPDDETLRVTMAGSHLALDLLEDGPARRQPKYAQALARNALRLLDLQPSDYHRRLAELYEPGLTQTYKQEIANRLGLAHSKDRLGAWACLNHLVELAVAWADEIVNHNWPDGHDQALDLLPIVSERGITSKLFSRMANSLPLFSPKELELFFFLFDRNKRPIHEDANRAVDLSKIDPNLPVIVGALGAVYGRGGNANVPVHLPSAVESPLKLKYFTLDRDSYDWLSLKDIKNLHPDWGPLVAVARFLENPSKNTLANELRIIACQELEDFRRPNLAVTKLAAPWPLAGCYLRAKNESELLTIADRVASGHFGDIEDWRNAEDRWRSKGVTAEDFYYSSRNPWPFDEQIADRGFPFNVCGFSFTHSEATGEFIDDLLEVYQRIGDDAVCSFVAHVLFVLITDFGGVGRKRELGLLTELFKHAKHFSRWVTIDFGAVTYELLVSSEGLRFFDEIGRLARLYSFRVDEGRIGSMFARVFSINPSKTGLLRIFSYIRDISAEPIPLKLLNPDLYDDLSIKEAAVVVRLGQRNLDSHEQADLARLTTDIAHQQVKTPFIQRLDVPGIVHRALSAVRGYEADDSCIEPFLLELRRNLSDKELQSAITDVLIEVLRLRLSRIRQPEVWSRLRLPQGLGRTLERTAS